MPRTLVLMPLYNEAPTLSRVLDEVRRWARDCDVLVVDDGSTDASPDILGAYLNVTVLTHTQNEGYGQSLIDGFNYAVAHGYEAVVTPTCTNRNSPPRTPRFSGHSP